MTALVLSPGHFAYRFAGAGDAGLERRAQAHLQHAADALALSLLALEGDEQDSRREKQRRGTRCREHLLEAVTQFARAKVFVAGVRSYSVAVVMDTRPDPDVELSRLNQMISHLLWHNHEYLPARSQAKPLTPDEEAALAKVFDGLARHARIDRFIRYRWLGAATGLAALAPVLGPGFGLAGAAVGAWAVLRLWATGLDEEG